MLRTVNISTLLEFQLLTAVEEQFAFLEHVSRTYNYTCCDRVELARVRYSRSLEVSNFDRVEITSVNHERTGLDVSVSRFKNK